MQSADTSGWEQVAESITDKNGKYHFDHLKSSAYGTGIRYRIVFDLPIDSRLTIPKSKDATKDSNALDRYVPGAGFPTDEIYLNYHTNDMTWDAGIIESRGTVGDYVWFDKNQNGIQDEKETGIANISVILEYNEQQDLSSDANWTVVGETKTNASGYYRFTNLVPGMYRVRFQIDKPYVVTLSNMGNDNAIDSDGVEWYQKNWYASRPFYLEEDGYDMTWDCGVYLPKAGKDSTSVSLHGVKTGDVTQRGLYVLLLAAAGVLLVAMRRKRKSQKQ